MWLWHQSDVVFYVCPCKLHFWFILSDKIEARVQFYTRLKTKNAFRMIVYHQMGVWRRVGATPSSWVNMSRCRCLDSWRMSGHQQPTCCNIAVFQRCRQWNPSLQWRHDDHDCVTNHRPHGCLLNRLFRRRSKKTPKLRVTGFCARNSPWPVNFPHKRPVTRKMFPFYDVIMLCEFGKYCPFVTPLSIWC